MSESEGSERIVVLDLSKGYIGKGVPEVQGLVPERKGMMKVG